MNFIGSLLLAATLVAAAPASAQVLDLSTIKCKEFVESSKETIGLILMWLDGYYTEDEDKAIIDFDKMKRKGEKLAVYCGANPTHGLMTAAEDILGN
jgi:acid stress chaperone HdeB